MPAIPPFVLKKLYVEGSLTYEDAAISVCLRNVIAPGTIIGVVALVLDDKSIDLAQVSVKPSGGAVRPAADISGEAPLQFPMGSEVRLVVRAERPAAGTHQLVVRVVAKDVGPLQIPISDTLG